MASLDVEALLDAAANGGASTTQNGHADLNGHSSSNGDHGNGKGHSNGGRSQDENDRTRLHTRSRSPDRDGDRERDRRRRDYRSHSPRSDTERTPRSEAGSYKSSRRRSRSRDREPRSRNARRRNRGRGRGGDDLMDGDHYSSRNGGRSRSRSPDRRYRPRDSRRDRDDDRGGRRREDRDYARRRRERSRERESSMPPLTEDERDRRTVFVQQLAARLRTRDLKEFFEKAGPVAEAQIVKDRVSNRSKGVGYVEFKSEETITAALQLTGQKLLGIPVIVQMTEAEKNRQSRSVVEAANNGGSVSVGVPFHRLYVGNIHFSITESDLRNVFEPFGELEFVQLQKDDASRSRGYGFVQFRDSDQAREALEKMNGFDLAGRPIRVGLGNDKFTPESTASLMKGFQGPDQPHQGSAFSGAGGRTQNASNFDRAGGRDNDKGSGAGALDDTDVAGVNFNNYSRDALMRKLARADDSPASSTAGNGSVSGTTADEQRPIRKPRTETKALPVNVNTASRCVVLHNMFDASEEEGESWIKELEDDVRQEAEDKYGHVVHVALDVNSSGDIYLKFDKVQGGENAIKGLNGRYFGGRMITAAPVVDAVYSSLFSRTKAI